ncbi:MAG TPA: hypothetical protein VM755_02705 [Stellaceae bacterium]|nr:hypothetical protein [Stellaceae bacterium]
MVKFVRSMMSWKAVKPSIVPGREAVLPMTSVSSWLPVGAAKSTVWKFVKPRLL